VNPFRLVTAFLVPLIIVGFTAQADERDRSAPLVEESTGNPKRVALLIGNSNYESAPLSNPSNDVDTMAIALRAYGFSVTKEKDRNKGQIEKAVDRITSDLQRGDLCLIFYAGHGLQMEGRNYLVPLEAELDRPHHVKQRCVSVSYLLDALTWSECSLKVVMVDACRNNPFRSLTRSTKDLAKLDEAPEGTIVAFSTSPKTTALDGTGRNSPYVKHLASVLRTNGSGLELLSLFREASRAVKAETGQIPYLEFDATMPDYILKSGTQPETSLPQMQKQNEPVARPSEITNELGMQLKLVPAGEFMMGCKQSAVDVARVFYGSKDSAGVFEREHPRHRVRITKPFYAGVHEVTIGSVLRWLNSGTSVDKSWIDLNEKDCPVLRLDGRFIRNSTTRFGRSDSQPMVHISWHGAVAFCDWLTGKDGRRYRLVPRQF